jgi:hypothetical protein
MYNKKENLPKQFFISVKLNSFLLPTTLKLRNSLSYLVKILKLLQIWSSAGIVSFWVIMIFYTLFLGRNQVVMNETIYENYRYVGKPNTAQLSSLEGRGLTTYGNNGLIVNKRLKPGTRRILFIGDSFVKAVQVSDREKFTEIVEQDWNQAHSDDPIQTLNLGLGGQHLDTYLSFARPIDRYFKPDLIFVVLNRNDFDDLAQDPARLAQVVEGVTEPLVEPEDQLAFADLVNQLGVRSFFGKLQLQTYGFLAKGSNAPPVEAAGQTGHFTNAVDIQLKGLKKIWGERLVIIYVTWFTNMAKDDPPPGAYKDTILDEIKKQNIALVNLYPPLWRAFQTHRPPFGFNNSNLGQGHLNQYGHKVVAAEIMKYLEGRL